MLEVLKLFNYTQPNFNLTSDLKTNTLGPTGNRRPFEIIEYKNCYYLFVRGEQWMMYDFKTHLQAAHFFSHYHIAEGDVITSGLGFGVREQWLLNNPKVKSITVLENNQDVINYHKEANPHFFEKMNIIHCDAKTYKGKCDTLLLDHYEWETMDEIIADVRNICTNNIECEKMWFWHLETQIIADIHNVKEDGICKRFREGKFTLNANNNKVSKKAYDLIKNNYGLNKLPNLTEEEIQLIISIYTEFFQVM